MKLRKMLLSMVLGSCLVLSACSSGGSKSDKTSDVNSKAKKEIEVALDNLKKVESPYLTTVILNNNSESSSFVEVNTEDGNYTEYPLNADGNVGLAYEDVKEDTKYVLSDWLTDDNNLYIVSASADSNGYAYYSTPEGYGDKLLSRKYLYVDKMLDKFTSIKEGKEVENNGEKMKTYECTLPSSEVKEIMGVSSLELYKSLKEDKDASSGIKKLCQYYIDEYDMVLTFSDAKVTLGVANDKLAYLSMEMGGLGTKMYLTKLISFTEDGSIDTLEKPDFKSAKNYSETLNNVADYVDTYEGTVEEALSALSQSGAGTTSEEDRDTKADDADSKKDKDSKKTEKK